MYDEEEEEEEDNDNKLWHCFSIHCSRRGIMCCLWY